MHVIAPLIGKVALVQKPSPGIDKKSPGTERKSPRTQKKSPGKGNHPRDRKSP